jgi:hypothetical protein
VNKRQSPPLAVSAVSSRDKRLADLARLLVSTAPLPRSVRLEIATLLISARSKPNHAPRLAETTLRVGFMRSLVDHHGLKPLDASRFIAHVFIDGTDASAESLRSSYNTDRKAGFPHDPGPSQPWPDLADWAREWFGGNK